MQVSYTPVSYKVTLPTETDPVKAKKNAEARANLTQALDTLKNSRVDYKVQKKAMAAQRVAQIKEKLKALRQTPGLDAKTTARLAANLAKELANAVKDYAAASGDKSANNIVSDTSSDTQNVDTGEDAAALNAIEPGAGATKQFSSATSLYSAAQSTVPTAKSSNDDKTFIDDVRFLHRGLKSLVTLQKERLKVEKPVFGYFANNAVNNASSDLDAVEKTLANMA